MLKSKPNWIQIVDFFIKSRFLDQNCFWHIAFKDILSPAKILYSKTSRPASAVISRVRHVSALVPISGKKQTMWKSPIKLIEIWSSKVCTNFKRPSWQQSHDNSVFATSRSSSSVRQWKLNITDSLSGGLPIHPGIAHQTFQALPSGWEFGLEI